MKKKIRFICGSIEQTRQMHAIANQLSDCDCRFAPYYEDDIDGWLKQMRIPLITSSALALREQCLSYLNAQGLAVDLSEDDSEYDLVVSGYSLIPDRCLGRTPLLLVQYRPVTQEMIDKERSSAGYRLGSLRRFLLRWVYNNPCRDVDRPYDILCAASEEHRELFIQNGADSSRIVVTGMPGLDDAESTSSIARECRKLLVRAPVAETVMEHKRAYLVC